MTIEHQEQRRQALPESGRGMVYHPSADFGVSRTAVDHRLELVAIDPYDSQEMPVAAAGIRIVVAQRARLQGPDFVDQPGQPRQAVQFLKRTTGKFLGQIFRGDGGHDSMVLVSSRLS